MKILTVLALALVLIIVVGTNVGAQQLAPGLSAVEPVGPFLLSFDEDGHATISVNGGPANTLTGTLLPDPSVPAGAGQQLVLTYLLPEPVITGDVSFCEPAECSRLASDWLRFTDAAGTISGAPTGTGPRMIFYSDRDFLAITPDALADTGFPTNIGTGNHLAQLEVGLEGNDGFDYRPGGVPYPGNNEYIGISDAVPEPATLLLMASGLLGLGGWRRYSAHSTQGGGYGKDKVKHLSTSSRDKPVTLHWDH